MNIIDKILAWFFGVNGVHLVQVYLVLLTIDVIAGFTKSAKMGRLKSRTYLTGVLVKMCAILVIIIANIMDDIFINYLHVDTGMSIAIFYSITLIGYEILSIIENLHSIGVFTGKMGEIVGYLIDMTNSKKFTPKKKDEDE